MVIESLTKSTIQESSGKMMVKDSQMFKKTAEE
jgi:hypothetical protein